MVIVRAAQALPNVRISGPMGSKARARNILKNLGTYGIRVAVKKNGASYTPTTKRGECPFWANVFFINVNFIEYDKQKGTCSTGKEYSSQQTVMGQLDSCMKMQDAGP